MRRPANSTDGWTVAGTQAYANARFLYDIGEIEAPALVLHGENAHSRYMGEAAYERMSGGIAPEDKELVIVPGASHTDLDDGGEDGAITWDAIADFFGKTLA